MLRDIYDRDAVQVLMDLFHRGFITKQRVMDRALKYNAVLTHVTKDQHVSKCNCLMTRTGEEFPIVRGGEDV